MISITPCRATVSDRFPIASFVVRVPPDRVFEVACATDPQLFRPDQRARRRPENFVTSAAHGLLRAPAGQATYLMPPGDLSRFAGAQRVYYALGAYRGAKHEDPVFTVAPQDPRLAPSIQLAADFTGRRVKPAPGAADARYGAPAAGAATAWGGDAVSPAPAAGAAHRYDDGLDPRLWDEPPPEEALPRAAEAAPADGAEPGPRFTADPTGEPPEATPLGGGADHDAEEPRGHEHPARAAATADADAEPRYGRGDPAGDEGVPGVEDPRHLLGGGVEPPGAEDPRALRATGRAGARVGAPDASGGFEDGPDLERAGARIGDVAPRDGTPRASGAGRSGAYANEYGVEELPDGEVPSPPVSIAAAAPERLHLIEVVAELEGGADGYAAVNPDGEYNDPAAPQYGRVHVGLSWGFVQFAQRYGALGQVLQACRRRDQRRGTHELEDVFGAEHVEELLRVTSAPTEEQRLAPVGGLPLWDPAWVERFRRAGGVTIFQEAQREAADQLFLLPNLQLAGWLGLNTPRALAMLFDRCVHMGPGGGPTWVVRVAGPIRNRAQRDAALASLGLSSLAELARSAGLPDDGRWGPAVHAALTSRLRALGDASPVPVPTCAELQELMVAAADAAAAAGDAGWQRAAERLAALADTDRLGDQVLRVP